MRDLLKLKLAGLPHEVFVCIQLDAQHRVIAIEEMFRGTLTQTSVYPREVVKAALRVNAAAVIFAHNHPSGVAQPSQADELLTRNVRKRCRLSMSRCSTISLLPVHCDFLCGARATLYITANENPSSETTGFSPRAPLALPERHTAKGPGQSHGSPIGYGGQDRDRPGLG